VFLFLTLCIYHKRGMPSPVRKLTPRTSPFWLAVISLVIACGSTANAQDWFKTETSTGASNIRIAVADFKAASTDGQTSPLKRTFDATLYADLATAGIFDIVSKSLAPQVTPGAPNEINLTQWSSDPASAAMVAFGSFAVQSGRLVANGFLFDAKNTQYPQVLAKQYNEDPNEESARQVAHRFADEIIFRLGGGIPGIAETKIYFVKSGAGNKEIWEMDYDGSNQHAITHLGTVSLSPRVAPDNSRLAFSSLGREGFQIKMYSLLLGRIVGFPTSGGASFSPAWSPAGKEVAYSSTRSGSPSIWISDSNGNLARRITSFKGGDVSPVYNPRTGAQIAWISGRTGLPQLYIMDADGSGVQRMTDGGYASSPSWSPNGQFLAFAWNRKYGPGAPGGQDIYVMEVATKRWIQLTHDGGRCDFPSWSPDGRHITYANTADGRPEHMKVWTMLVDGTQRRALTGPGADMPNWSWK
jgi:TolB protein